MSIWIFLIAAIPFFIGYFISRQISSKATQALEPDQKAMLVDFSTSSQKYSIIWLVVAIVPIFIIPRAGFLIFALVILVGNWLTLKRLWSLEFPETYKQQSLIASVIFTVGILISVISFYSALYIF